METTFNLHGDKKAWPLKRQDIENRDEIMDVLINVLAHYREIGGRLHLSDDKLDEIDRKKMNSASSMEAVIVEWLKKNYNNEKYGPPTWKALVAAVEHPAGGNNKAEAEKIANKLISVQREDSGIGSLSSEDIGLPSQHTGLGSQWSIGSHEEVKTTNRKRSISLIENKNDKRLCIETAEDTDGQADAETVPVCVLDTDDEGSDEENVRKYTGLRDSQVDSPPSLSDYDEESKEKYIWDLEETTDEIKRKFSLLILRIIKSLDERKVPHQAVASLYITMFGYSYNHKNQPLVTSLRRACNVHEIHDVVMKEEMISYCNFEIIETLVEEHGCPQDKKEMEEYKKYFEEHVIIMYKNRIRCGKLLRDRKKVVFKVEHDLLKEEEGIAGKMIKEMKKKIGFFLKDVCVHPSSLYLKSVKTGCLEFEFLVPGLIYDHISELSAENKRKMFKEEISFIQLFGYDSSDNMVKPSSPRNSNSFLSTRRNTKEEQPSDQCPPVPLAEKPEIDPSNFTHMVKPIPWECKNFYDDDEVTSDHEAAIHHDTLTLRPHYKPLPFIKVKSRGSSKSNNKIKLELEESQTLILKLRRSRFKPAVVEFDSSSDSDSDSDDSVDYYYDDSVSIRDSLHRASSFV